MGYIYVIKNHINSKKYVGKTTRTVEIRFKEHLNNIYERNNCLYLAMRKYGKENFYAEELEKCDNEILDIREKYWIEYFDTYKQGYNETLGGEGMPLINYDERLKEYLNQNLSIRDISKITGISTNSISAYYNTIFSKEEIKNKANKIIGSKNSTIIEQYDLNGNFIKEYPSLKSIPNICHRNISDVLNRRRRSAGGFLWKKKNDPTPIEDLVMANKNKHKRGE